MTTYLRIFKYVFRHPWMALSAFILSLLGSLLVLVAPLMTKRFFDEIIPQKAYHLIVPTLFLAIGGIALRQLFLVCSTLVHTSFEEKLIHNLRQELYNKIQRMPLSFFDTKKSGDLMSRVSSDIPSMEAVIAQGVGQGLSGIIQATVILSYLFYQHQGLTLIALSPMPIVALITWLYSKYGEPRYRILSEVASRLNHLLHENLAGIRQIKAYTVEDERLNQFTHQSDLLKQAQMKVVQANAVTWPTVSFVAESGLIIMLGAGAYWVLKGDVTEGTMLAFMAAWGYFYEPFSRIGPLGKVFARGKASGTRVFEILDQEEEANLSEGTRLNTLRGHIVFKDVSFGYQADQPEALSHISLDISPGKTIAFVGPTGAGKSTLLNLLTGFYSPTKGDLLIDGTPIQEFSKQWLRQHIAYVTQESFLFHSTVRENLLLAKEDASDEELWEALESAHAADFVRRLPAQLDTLTGERGIRFSGGEKQRISIARALLKNPPILLLDEATSAVDNSTEQHIQEALERLRAHRTCFVIAHRLSTIEHADQICVLKQGRIHELGTHQELLKKQGAYYNLYHA